MEYFHKLNIKRQRYKTAGLLETRNRTIFRFAYKFEDVLALGIAAGYHVARKARRPGGRSALNAQNNLGDGKIDQNAEYIVACRYKRPRSYGRIYAPFMEKQRYKGPYDPCHHGYGDQGNGNGQGGKKTAFPKPGEK
jgi:hypothetical protein